MSSRLFSFFVSWELSFSHFLSFFCLFFSCLYLIYKFDIEEYKKGSLSPFYFFRPFSFPLFHLLTLFSPFLSISFIFFYLFISLLSSYFCSSRVAHLLNLARNFTNHELPLFYSAPHSQSVSAADDLNSYLKILTDCQNRRKWQIDVSPQMKDFKQ